MAKTISHTEVVGQFVCMLEECEDATHQISVPADFLTKAFYPYKFRIEPPQLQIADVCKGSQVLMYLSTLAQSTFDWLNGGERPSTLVAFEARLCNWRAPAETGSYWTTPPNYELFPFAEEFHQLLAHERSFWYADAFHALTSISTHCERAAKKEKTRPEKRCKRENEIEPRRDQLIIHIIDQSIDLPRAAASEFLKKPFNPNTGRLHVDEIKCEHEVLARWYIKFPKPSSPHAPVGTSHGSLGVIEVVFVATKSGTEKLPRGLMPTDLRTGEEVKQLDDEVEKLVAQDEAKVNEKLQKVHDIVIGMVHSVVRTAIVDHRVVSSEVEAGRQPMVPSLLTQLLNNGFFQNEKN